ncbi:exodeoxyribonuclease V subunit alpha [Catenovulum sp. SM1970]|uniref:exodeoxyribonuclease V subunit alpha n=1 Tax=Marinifaba aquimaris TaxID=2741323 RepID=UPI001571D2EF|nr:exodeoxyribonuclease V subunit alpha [Marinifaba aquimaris]NTS78562.1 exodeoxyribonuclease V subunit alpha [Marinifaba aquimaris]
MNHYISRLEACLAELAGIEAIDFYLAQRLCQRLAVKDDDISLMMHLIIRLSQSVREGHACIDVVNLANKQPWFKQLIDESTGLYQFPSEVNIISVLNQYRVTPDDQAEFVFDSHTKLLYLRRYWQFETELATLVNTKLSVSNLDEQQITKANQLLSHLFDQSSTTQLDWQKIAVANSLDRSLAIIIGGPGTGKTTTVVKLLATLCSINEEFNIALVAPTGKAAQRLSESIIKAKQTLNVDNALKDKVPEQATTIHRLLGIGSQAHKPKFNKTQRLDYDLILIDEASMVDLALMTRLFRALSDNTRVLLLGDADQLPSVSTGSVLADIAPRPIKGFSLSRCQYLDKLNANPQLIDNHALDFLTELKVSYRFDENSGIGHLAKATLSGDYQTASAILLDTVYQDICYQPQLTEDTFNHYVDAYIGTISNAESVQIAFSRLNQFRFLCATREGEQGVDQINIKVEARLKKLNKIARDSDYFYHAKPIMITANHYNLNLYNGDIGLIWHHQGKLMVAFESSEGIRWLSLSRLPKHETVYAMTIHKTQGSEFGHVVILLPDYYSSIMSRELIYTGLTRAKSQLAIFGENRLLKQAIEHRVERQSGLAARIKKAH